MMSTSSRKSVTKGAVSVNRPGTKHHIVCIYFGFPGSPSSCAANYCRMIKITLPVIADHQTFQPLRKSSLRITRSHSCRHTRKKRYSSNSSNVLTPAPSILVSCFLVLVLYVHINMRFTGRRCTRRKSCCRYYQTETANKSFKHRTSQERPIVLRHVQTSTIPGFQPLDLDGDGEPAERRLSTMWTWMSEGQFRTEALSPKRVRIQSQQY